MQNKILFYKISSVGLSRLLLILSLKVLRELTELFERIILFFHNSSYCLVHIVNEINIRNSFKSYFELCYNDDKLISTADLVIDGTIELFEKKIVLDNDNWLTDPISGKKWPPDIFFANAKVEMEGFGDVKYVMEINKLYHLVILAQAFFIKEDNKYLEKIAVQLDGQRKQVKYERSVVNKSMLDLVYRCYNLIHISMLCYKSDYFKKEILPKILIDLLLLERQIRKFSTPRWCKYSTGANHTIGEMAGLITVQQFLQFFTCKDYDKYLKTEYKYLYRSLDRIITDKGVYLEQSANYAKLVAEFLMLQDIFVSGIGTERSKELYRDDYLRVLLSYIDTLSYNGKLPNFGDNDGAKATTLFYKERDSVEHLIKYYMFRFPDADKQMVLMDEISGQFVWKSENNSFYLFTRCGQHSFLPVGSGSHAHNDLLALWIGVNGRELFIDYGTFYYNSGLEILNKVRATSVHNTLSIEGVEQAALAGKWMYGDYPNSSIDEVKTKIEEDWFCFDGTCEYNGRKHRRALKYEDSTLWIQDVIDCNPEDIISLHFILAPSVTVSTNQLGIEFLIEEKLVATLMADSCTTITRETIEYHPSYGITEETTSITLTANRRGSQEILTKLKIEL